LLSARIDPRDFALFSLQGFLPGSWCRTNQETFLIALSIELTKRPFLLALSIGLTEKLFLLILGIGLTERLFLLALGIGLTNSLPSCSRQGLIREALPCFLCRVFSLALGVGPNERLSLLLSV
jgi:hypothetical protein